MRKLYQYTPSVKKDLIKKDYAYDDRTCETYDNTKEKKENLIIECMTYIKEKYDYDKCTCYTYDKDFTGDLSMVKNALEWIFTYRNQEYQEYVETERFISFEDFCHSKLTDLKNQFDSFSVIRMERRYSSFLVFNYCIVHFNKFSNVIEISIPSKYNCNFLALPVYDYQWQPDTVGVEWHGFKNCQEGFIHHTRIILYQSDYFPYLRSTINLHNTKTRRQFELSIEMGNNGLLEECTLSILYNSKVIKTNHYCNQNYRTEDIINEFLFPLFLDHKIAEQLDISHKSIQEHLAIDYSNEWNLYKMIKI